MMAEAIRNADLFTSDNVTGALGGALNVILHSMTERKAEFTSLEFIERCVREEMESQLYWSVERAVHFDGEDI